MKTPFFIILFTTLTIMLSCKSTSNNENVTNSDSSFKYVTEQFADLRILRYNVPIWEKLSLKQKELAYYLTQAAFWGRDIHIDQNYKYNLVIIRTLSAIVTNFKGDKNTPEFKKFMEYTKRVWFSNGIHHHYSMDKFLPEFTSEYFIELIKNSPDGKFPLETNQSLEQLYTSLIPIIFDPKIDNKRVCLSEGIDVVKNSACNFYENISQEEAEKFYESLQKKDDLTPVSYGLNSKLVKENGKISEKTYKIGGMYGSAIKKIVFWLEKAASVAENPKQKAWLDKLIAFYKTGDLKTFDEYCILWLKDTESVIDATNGFIEQYGDPLGFKGAWQATVSIKDLDLTKEYAVLANEAAWFEKNSPIDAQYKKENPTGISYKVIQVVGESGDNAPSTPIGVNLPNSNWIREQYGSKSVSLGNIEDAYFEASKSSGVLQEFNTTEQIERMKKYGLISGKLHTGLHEVIGHGSGKIKPEVIKAKKTLKNYANTIEETRADLVALYYMLDPHMIEIKLIPSLEAGKAEYDAFITGGLMKQLARLELGSNVEEAHMRNRQLISLWCFEKGKKDNIIEKKIINGKTFFVINNYEKLRSLFGELLREIQRITSEADFDAAKKLVETYGVIVDKELHKEVKQRYAKLNIAPYNGFIQPILKPVINNGVITDVKIEYPADFTEQMLYFDNDFSILPNGKQ